MWSLSGVYGHVGVSVGVPRWSYSCVCEPVGHRLDTDSRAVSERSFRIIMILLQKRVQSAAKECVGMALRC